MKKQKPNFEEALNAASLWCNAWDIEELSDEVLADRVSELLETKEGARAFFVISLSSKSPLMDRIPEPLLIQLRNAGELVVDLTVRNLAMSTAMSLHHQREESADLQIGSERIKERCIELLRKLEPSKVKARLEVLLAGTKGKGSDIEFLDHWKYDSQQKNAIAKSINSVAEN